MINMAEEKAVWPPDYTIRRSTRARRIFLQMIPKQGLEIVIPTKQKQINIAPILEEKRRWIEKMLFRVKKTLLADPNSESERPTIIDCQALEEKWNIVYEYLPNTSKITLMANVLPNKSILLKGNVHHVKLCHRILIKWLKQYAYVTLIPWLKKLSETNELLYQQAIIRGQSTLWGSCNAKKNISLNYKLLFLPHSLTQYVLLHELCHLKYLNHSARFWQYLKTLDEDCLLHRKKLRAAQQYLPLWLDNV